MLRAEVADWPALQRWQPDALVRRVGDRPVPVEWYPEGRFVSAPGCFRLVRFADYLDAAREGSARQSGRADVYLAEVRLRDVFPELVDDVRPPPFLAGRELKWLMFYGVDSFTALHYHSHQHALLCQVVGEKRVVLLRPAARGEPPLNPWWSDRFHFARRPQRVDEVVAVAHPADVVDVVLAPGDALTIPVGWLHVVESAGTSGSLTFFWRAWLDAIGLCRYRPALLASLALRQVRGGHASFRRRVTVEATSLGLEPWPDGDAHRPTTRGGGKG